MVENRLRCHVTQAGPLTQGQSAASPVLVGWPFKQTIHEPCYHPRLKEQLEQLRGLALQLHPVRMVSTQYAMGLRGANYVPEPVQGCFYVAIAHVGKPPSP